VSTRDMVEQVRLSNEVIDEVLLEEKLEAFNTKLHSGHYTYPAKYDEFKADLLQAHGVTGNPKSDRAFSLAWEQGHSCGYSEVAIVFADLVELIK